MKEIKGETDTWKDIPTHGLEGLILLKCPYCPKQSIDSMQCISKF